MTLERFTQLLDIHGADLARFPEAERAAAELLLVESAEARSALEEAQLLEGALGSVESVEPSPDFAKRIAAIPARHPRTGAWWPFATRYRPALAMVAAALLGIGVGNWAYSSNEAQVDELSVSDVEELTELALSGETGDTLGDELFDLGEASP
jgi:hypothetical protein